jgi:hypothetical protein
MYKKRLLTVLLGFLALMTIPQIAKAATITSCVLDKDSYLQGQTGYIGVTIYNDKDDKIRVTELSATIDYYYSDGVVYIQTFFFPDTDLPDEIAEGQSKTYNIPISLPNNIASGYTNPIVHAHTELWFAGSSRWVGSDYPTYTELKLYIESPYKQQYEDTEKQYEEQLGVNGYVTNMMNLFIVTTIAFASAAGVLFLFFTRKTMPIAQPAQ